MDLAKYGLDKPGTTIRVTATQAGEKTETHTLAVGGLVDKGDGARYARLDNGPGIVVLPRDTVAELTHSYLDFADRGLLKFNGGEVKLVGRKMGNADLAVEKKDGRWQITAPKAEKADDADLDEFVQRLSGLRAERVAAYQPKEFAASGPDKPRDVWTLKTAADDKKPVILKVGKVAGKGPRSEVADPEGDRFVQAEGGQTVGVLPGDRPASVGRRSVSVTAPWPSPMPTMPCSSAARAGHLHQGGRHLEADGANRRRGRATDLDVSSNPLHAPRPTSWSPKGDLAK